MKVNVKEARMKLAHLLNRVEGGDEVSITRRGREVARLVPPHAGIKTLPNLQEFRSSIRLKGSSMSSLITRMRQEERY